MVKKGKKKKSADGMSKKKKKKERERKEAVRNLQILVQKHTDRQAKINQRGQDLSINQMIEDILELQVALKKVISSQSGSEGNIKQGIKKSIEEKKIALKKFAEWLQKISPDSGLGKKWDFDINIEKGNGIIALENLNDNTHFMSISRKAMISEHTCWQSPVGKLLKADQVCQRLPSLALAVFVLFERLNPSSFYQPYLSVLEDRSALPLFFSLDDLSYLSASPNYRDILSLKKTTARQYAHLYSILRKAGHLQLPPFEWIDFQWAVGIVMARQNRIPSITGHGDSEITLIPGWDFCNYRGGKVTSYFDPPSNTMQSFTMMPVAKGDPIYLHYGNRPNGQLFLFKGVSYLENQSDFLEFQLPGPSSDNLFKIRKLLLLKYNLINLPPFVLPLKLNKDGKLLSYLRIVNMTKDEAAVLLKRENKGKVDYISERNEEAGREFLINALNKLSLSYNGTINKDRELLNLIDSTSASFQANEDETDADIESARRKTENMEIKKVSASLKQSKPQRPQKSQVKEKKKLSQDARLCVLLRLSEKILIQRGVTDARLLSVQK